MRKWSLVTAILLLSSAWLVAQNSSTPPTVPDNSQATQQQPDKSQASAPPAGANHSAQTLEGCVSGSAGAFTLTDAAGKSYQLGGDTSKLADHVGHTVQVSGTEEAGGMAAAGAPATFTVKKVKMLSASCANK